MQGKTLLVHIGAHKTGSTTLQEAFASQSVGLDGARVLYPARLDHNYLRADFITHSTGKPLPKRGPRLLGFGALAKAIEASDADYTLLSGEYFEKLAPELMAEVLEQYFAPHVDRIKIIAYLRPHAERFLSGYAEALKIGWYQKDMDAFFDDHRDELLFYPRFSAWQATFGESFELHAMHRSRLKGGSVLQDFVERSFDGHRAVSLPERSSNTSLGLEDLVLLRFVQARFVEKRDWFRHTFGWELARQLRTGAPLPASQEKLELYEALAAKLRETCSADAAEIDATFFPDDPLFSEALEKACTATRKQPQSLQAEDHFSPEELRILTALRELLWDTLRTRKDWASFFHSFRAKALEGDTDPQSSARAVAQN